MNKDMERKVADMETQLGIGKPGAGLSYTKNIPARTETYHFRWFKKDWMEYSERFKAIRSGSRKNKMDKCYKCHTPFQYGDMMAIGSVESKGNKVFCQACATELLEADHD